MLAYLLGNALHGVCEYAVHVYLHLSPKNKCKYDEGNGMHNVHHLVNTSSTFEAIRDSMICMFFLYAWYVNGLPFVEFITGILSGYSLYKIFHIVEHRCSSILPDFTGIMSRKYHHTHHSSPIYDSNFGVTTLTLDYIFGTMDPNFTLNTFGKITGFFPITIPLAFRYGLIKIKN